MEQVKLAVILVAALAVLFCLYKYLAFVLAIVSNMSFMQVFVFVWTVFVVVPLLMFASSNDVSGGVERTQKPPLAHNQVISGSTPVSATKFAPPVAGEMIQEIDVKIQKPLCAS